MAVAAQAVVADDPAAAADRFAADGVVCLRGLFRDWVEPLRGVIDEVMALPRDSAVNHAEGKGGVFFHDVDLWKHFDTVKRFAFTSAAPAIARALTGARALHLYGDHLLVKEPGSPSAQTPWHQDEPYLRAAGTRMLSIWVALDPVTTDTGAMRFVPGSNRWGRLFRPVRFAHGEEFALDRFAESVPDIDGDPERTPTVSFNLAPGDCTVHHIRTLHSSGGNQSLATRRRALVVRYAGEDARYVAPNKAALRSADPKRAPGETLDPAEFPAVP
ncbi:MAG: phytanoyl-CoA dioxygenase family protein [Bauldia sp.]|nr:phytanoyl-CoA dioxygenase family protein [Bauldia sp.]